MTNVSFFYFFLFSLFLLLLENIFGKTQFIFVTFVLQLFQVTGYWKCSNKTPTLIQICSGAVDAILQHKTLESRLDILTLILIAMYYYFFLLKFLRSTFNLEKKSICYVKYLFHPVQATGSIYLALFFNVYIYIPQRYVHNLERNWKNSVCISVKNFAICKFLNFTAHFH